MYMKYILQMITGLVGRSSRIERTRILVELCAKGSTGGSDSFNGRSLLQSGCMVERHGYV